MVESQDSVPIADLREVWAILSSDERVEGFRSLPREDAEEFFEALGARARAIILVGSPASERRAWLRTLPPDDCADVLQEVEPEERAELLALVDSPARVEVIALLAYAEDQAGGLMSPRAARVRPTMTVEEAISYLRRQVNQELETIYYVYAVDADQRLRGVVSLRQLFMAHSGKRVEEVMETEVISVPADLDQESVARIIASHDLLAVPVVDDQGRMKGIVTVDDIVDVVQEEATEDIQKMGGMEALDAPYLQTSLVSIVRKRAGWLSLLLIGGMLTTSAMARFQDYIETAVVLGIFVPLIISSGGNSGSQASTLVIRAMALGEVRPADWWLILRRELFIGFALGLVLFIVALMRVLLWGTFGVYGDHYVMIAFAVAISVIGCTTCGTLAGAMLPFVLRKLGADPASASAPFVATLVDVSGILIYFGIANLVLKGVLPL